jgi:hypothetical protein
MLRGKERIQTALRSKTIRKLMAVKALHWKAHFWYLVVVRQIRCTSSMQLQCAWNEMEEQKSEHIREMLSCLSASAKNVHSNCITGK